MPPNTFNFPLNLLLGFLRDATSQTAVAILYTALVTTRFQCAERLVQMWCNPQA